jgi:hypothetical protein
LCGDVIARSCAEADYAGAPEDARAILLCGLAYRCEAGSRFFRGARG